MTNTEAQQIIANLIFILDGTLSDAELEALVMAGEALEEEKWISVDKMLPPITDEEDRTSDEMLVLGRIGGMAVAYYDYCRKEWVDNIQCFQNITHWRHLPKGPEVD